MSNNPHAVSILLSSLLMAQPVFANPEEAIQIEADHMQMNLDTGSSIYTGNVIFRKPDIVLSGDRIVLKRSGAQAGTILLSGSPARFEQKGDEQTTKAQSRSMTFKEKSNILIMRDAARLDHDDQVIQSDFIRYNTADRMMLAGGKKKGESEPQRVNITLSPEKDEE